MKKSIIEKFQRSYNGDKTIVFYDQEIEHRDRMLFVLEEKTKDLLITDLDLYEKVKERFDVSYPMVLRDVMIIERMIANDLNPSGDPLKTFTRYFIVENAKKALKDAFTKKDGKAISMLLNTIGKNMLTDKEDIIKPEYEKIIPFLPEITFDPSVIGITLPENFEEIRAKYKLKYDADYKNFVRKMTVTEAETISEDQNGD
jgi:hypothetical protein